MKPALLKVDVGLSLLCFIVSLTSLKVQKKIPDRISAPGLGVLGGVGLTGLVKLVLLWKFPLHGKTRSRPANSVLTQT